MEFMKNRSEGRRGSKPIPKKKQKKTPKIERAEKNSNKTSDV